MGKIDSDQIERYEDIEDMMDHAHEKIIEAVYYFCLCTKLNLPSVEEKIIKALMMEFISGEFDDLWPKLIAHVETKGNDTLVYGLILRD